MTIRSQEGPAIGWLIKASTSGIEAGDVEAHRLSSSLWSADDSLQASAIESRQASPQERPVSNFEIVTRSWLRHSQPPPSKKAPFR